MSINPDAFFKLHQKRFEEGSGLSHSDAEDVIWFSSLYECTAESQSATKKPHKMRRSADKIGGSRHLKQQKQYF
jgi:hypothetical protein